MMNYFSQQFGKYLFFLYRIQPVYVADVAFAVVAALKDDGSNMGKVYELGGPDVYTLHQLVIDSHDFFCPVQNSN